MVVHRTKAEASDARRTVEGEFRQQLDDADKAMAKVAFDAMTDQVVHRVETRAGGGPSFGTSRVLVLLGRLDAPSMSDQVLVLVRPHLRVLTVLVLVVVARFLFLINFLAKNGYLGGFKAGPW